MRGLPGVDEMYPQQLRESEDMGGRDHELLIVGDLSQAVE
jgi:hypothetical protein